MTLILGEPNLLGYCYCASYVGERAKAMSQRSSQNWLIFVDTNIFLDFYRLGGEAATRQLKALEKHTESLIICEQVWMEFLKNRQSVIVQGLQQIKQPTNTEVPAIVVDSQATMMLHRKTKEASENVKRLRKTMEKILFEPMHHDNVYKGVARIFKAGTKYNLKRPSKERYAVRNLARKRFVLGYPPRKKGDTSIGDAINWEWIIRCAQNSNDNHHILIVSRDSDFGVNYKDDSIINDWLYREFKDRVSKKRKIELTSKLTLALKRLDETVTQQDEEVERKIIEGWKTVTRTKTKTSDQNWEEIYKIFLTELKNKNMNILPEPFKDDPDQ